MKLIVGLGNPDRKYLNTYHNMGFLAVDALADKFGVKFTKEKCKAVIAETNANGEKIIIAKPLTYMNLSGESVFELLNFYKIELKDLIIIYDDYDINKGNLRIRKGGSAGTHNGMRNIVSMLGETDFARIRIGIKDENSRISLIDYVLSQIDEESFNLLKISINSAAEAAFDFAHGKKLDDVMQKYNFKKD